MQARIRPRSAHDPSQPVARRRDPRPAPCRLLARPRRRARRQAGAHRRPERPHADLRGPQARRPRPRRRARRPRLRTRRHAGDPGAEPAGVRDRLPRCRVRRRRGDHHQPDVHRARGPPPARRRRRPAAGDRGAVPRHGQGRRRGHERRGDLRHRRGRGGALLHRADGRAAGRAGARRPGLDGRAPLLLRHHGHQQGRDADPPQPRRERRADAGRRRHARGRDDRGRAAVLPHLRHAGADELRAARGRHDRHDAALRPRAVPLDPPGVRRHPVVRRTADRGRDGQAPARRQLRHVQARAGLLGRGAAVGRAGPRGRQAPRLRGGPGLRHDRAVTGLAPDAAPASSSRDRSASRRPTPRCASSTR